ARVFQQDVYARTIKYCYCQAEIYLHDDHSYVRRRAALFVLVDKRRRSRMGMASYWGGEECPGYDQEWIGKAHPNPGFKLDSSLVPVSYSPNLSLRSPTIYP